MMKIEIRHSDFVALVDDADYELVAEHKWTLQKTKVAGLFYAQSVLNGKSILMHRMILGLSGRHVLCDHKNHDGLDNQRRNLRVASHQNNLRNRKGWSQSGFKGVSFENHNKSRPWLVRLFVNRRTITVGRFATAEDGAAAYDLAAGKLYGEFAMGNHAALKSIPPAGDAK